MNEEERKVLPRWWEQHDYLKFYLPKPDTAMLARIYGPDRADWPLYNDDSKKRLGERAARAYDEARTRALLEEPPRYLSGTLMPSLPGRRSAVMSPSEMMLALVRAEAVVITGVTS